MSPSPLPQTPTQASHSSLNSYGLKSLMSYGGTRFPQWAISRSLSCIFSTFRWCDRKEGSPWPARVPTSSEIRLQGSPYLQSGVWRKPQCPVAFRASLGTMGPWLLFQ